MKIGDILRGKVEKLTDRGWGIVNSPSGKINLHYVIENEEIEFRVKEKAQGVYWGEILKLITPSGKRVKVKCPLYNYCGGCNLMHINYEGQLEYKRKLLIKNLLNFSNFPPEKINIVPSPPFNYRLRAKLKGRDDGKIGFIKKGKTEVIELRDCLLFHPRINEFINTWNSKEKMPHIPQIDLLFNYQKDTLYAHLSKSPPEDFPFSAFKKTVFSYKGNEISSISELHIGEYKYLLSPISFFQSNIFLLKKILDKVETYSPSGETAIDLYSGVGFFIPILKKKFKRVYAVESSKFSYSLLTKNFQDIKAYRIQSSKFSFPPAELIILDPPRSGVEERAMKRLLKRRYPKIIYLSCSQKGFSKDLKKIIESGYLIKRLSLLDLFPHTPYFETIALLEAQ